MVYYRKYRPQKIEDLDSKTVRETLVSILSKEPPHAFLFTGPKGLGKTSAARIIAKVVNCTNRQLTVNNSQLTTKKEKLNVKGQLSNVDFLEPCNKCEQCKSITEGSNMDILEIDAASNRGIDEIRDLKEKIRLAPMGSKKKVYIIDEVHMLTTEAFNALLKTLEEPPEHAMFILCTTEPQKVPDTIISRCFHINFNLATYEEIVHSLKRIVTEEKIKVDDESLLLIAQMADGGFRDAAKILEEITLVSEGKITKEILEKSYNTKSIPLYINGLLSSFKSENKKDAALEGLRTVEKMVSQGVDIKSFIVQVLTELDKKLLQEVGLGKKSENEKGDLKLDILEIKTLARIFNQVYQETKTSVLQQLPLEIAIIEWSMTSNQAEPDPGPSRNIKQPSPAIGTASIGDMRKQVGNIRKIKAMYGSPAEVKQSTANQDSESENSGPKNISASLLSAPGNGEISEEWLATFWKNIISEMKIYNHTAAGVLRGCSIGSFDKKNLVIATSYKFHKERLDDMKTKTELSKITKMLTGKDVTVVVELRSK